jgi:hypothetical protein
LVLDRQILRHYNLRILFDIRFAWSFGTLGLGLLLIDNVLEFLILVLRVLFLLGHLETLFGQD